MNLLNIGCLFMLIYSCIVVNKNKRHCNLKDIDMMMSPTEKFIILTEGVALLTKIFMRKNKFLMFLPPIYFEKKCFLDRYAAIFFYWRLVLPDKSPTYV